MTMYNTLSITGTSIPNNNGAEAVTVTLTALSPYFDTANNVEINPQPVTATPDVNGNWTLAGILDPTPDASGIPWQLAIKDESSGTTIYSRDVQPAFSRGRSQPWLSLSPPPSVEVTQDGLAWMGTWSDTTAYTVNDAVQYQGSAYVATATTTGTSPGSASATASPWRLLAHAEATRVTDVAGAAATSGAYSFASLGKGSIAAAPGEFILVDASTEAATVTLPAAPPDQSTVTVKPLTSGYASTTASAPYAVTVQCGGSDTIDKTSVTSVQLSALGQTLALQYDSGLNSWITVTDDMPTSQLDGRFERVVSVKAAPFNAKGDDKTDDTEAIQAAINYARSINAVTFFPSSGTASYRVSHLDIPQGAILEGVSSGSYGTKGNESIAGLSTLTRIDGTNRDLLSIPSGSNYCRIRDIQINGNKNNKTAGDGIHISDYTPSDNTQTGEEAQVIIERCYVHRNPGHNIYLGKGRRANKVLNSVCNYAGKDGICVAGSDNTVMHNICGTNARAGINLGTTTALWWPAEADEAALPNSAAVTHVIGNDVYNNLVGINVSAGSWGNVISSNGIDRNIQEGVAVYNGDAPATIHANVFHSNGNTDDPKLPHADGPYPHIHLGKDVGAVEIAANIFGPQDGGVKTPASYGVQAESPSTNIHGDLGILQPPPNHPSTSNGLVCAAPGVWASTRGDCTGVWTAADQGLIAWSEDPAMATESSQVPAAGVLYVRRVRVPTACSVTSVLVSVKAPAASLSNCYAALFDKDGAKVAGSADQSGSGSNWSSGTGVKTVALSGGPHQIDAGDYYIGIIANGTRLPGLACGSGQAATMANVGMSSGFRTATGSSGNTSVPSATGTLTASEYSFWMALS